MQSLFATISHESEAFARTRGFDRFYRGLSTLEAARVTELWACVQALTRDDAAEAQRRAEKLTRSMPDEDDPDGALAVRTFADALLSRIRRDSDTGGNLYLEARPPGAQLRAFELLRLRTPLIPFAYAAANRALFAMLERKPQDVTILDIGIGRGGQIRALLRNPLARERVQTLRVIGVEPDSSSETGTGALEIARARILEAAAEAGIRASFVGISKRAEDLTNDDVHRARPEGFFLANAAFALHHIDFEGSGGNDRGELLALVRSVGASAIVLVEPDSNHFIDALQVRFLYAYRHYRTVALSLDAMLPPANAQLVWNEFFAPEILNIIANEAGDRTERHEEAQQWSTHLRKAGWENSGLDALVPRSGTPHGFSVDTDGPAFSLCFRDVALLSVLRGTCPKIRPAETLEDPRE